MITDDQFSVDVSIPAINLSLDKVQKKSGEKFWSRSKLYNIDFLLIPVSRFFIRWAYLLTRTG